MKPTPATPPATPIRDRQPAVLPAPEAAPHAVGNTAENAVIEWTQVHKHYIMGQEIVRALRGVDLTVRAGEYWAVMGPSGSGKSTLLNLLGCLDRPTRGHCRLYGNDLGELSDDQLSNLRLRHLGFIFQSFNLIPQLSVRENIELPLFYLGWDRIRAFGLGRNII